MIVSEDKQVVMKTVIDGNPNNPIMLFIHGYPDDQTIWSEQIAYFKDRFYCLRVVLPNFGGKVDRDSGFDFPEVIDLIKAAVDKLNREGKPIILVTHDWGAVYGYLFEKQYPDLVKKMIALDIGGRALELSSFLKYLMIPFYQINLALAFLMAQRKGIGVLLGQAWTDLTLALVRFLGSAYTSKELTLSGPSRRSAFNLFQNYPYYYFWKQIFFEGKSLSDGAGFQPNCPVLFVYGCQGLKSLMSFHDRQWLEYLEQKPESKAVAFETAGHWLMRDSPTKLNHLIDDFLANEPETNSILE